MSINGISKYRPDLWIGREDELNAALLADIFKTRASIGKIWLWATACLIAGILAIRFG
jgi:hypothetical protein